LFACVIIAENVLTLKCGKLSILYLVAVKTSRMDRKSGYHVDIDRHISKRESMRDSSVRSSSVSSGSLSSRSTMHTKSNKAPKILAVVLVSLVVLAVVGGVTFYLLEIEKLKLQNQQESQVNFGEAYTENKRVSLKKETTEVTTMESEDFTPTRTTVMSLVNRQKLLEMAKQRLLSIRDRQSRLSGKKGVDDILRPSQEEESIISSLISGGSQISIDNHLSSRPRINPRQRQPSNDRTLDLLLDETPRQESNLQSNHQANHQDANPTTDYNRDQTTHFDRDQASHYSRTSTTPDYKEEDEYMQDYTQEYQDLNEDLEFGGVGLFGPKPNHRYNENPVLLDPVQNIPDRKSTPSNNMNERQEMYDMSLYRNNNNRRLRPGLEGIHRGIDLDESMLESLGGEEDNVPYMDKNIITKDGSIRPSEPLSRPTLDPLVTIDRRPNRPTFHHQGPVVRPGMMTKKSEVQKQQPKFGPEQIQLMRQLISSGKITRQQLREIRRDGFTPALREQLMSGNKLLGPQVDPLLQLPSEADELSLPRQTLLSDQKYGREGETALEGLSTNGRNPRIGDRRDGSSRPFNGRTGLPINGRDGIQTNGRDVIPTDRRVDGMTIKGRDGMPLNGRDGVQNNVRNGMHLNGRDGFPVDGRDGMPFNGRPLMGRRPFGGRRRLRGPQASKYRQDQLAVESSPLVDHESILDNFDSFVKLAGSELLGLKDVAKNISQSGGDMNLWEIVSAVNSTVRKNPDSNMAKLMEKFEDRYLSSDDSVNSVKPADVVYERSLSSLLFLSMGIFLLNSVNELVDTGSIPGESEGRSLPTNEALKHLADNSLKHQEIFQLFNMTSLDLFDEPSSIGALGALLPSTAVNNYVKLVMNLMNAYVEDTEEFECIYAAYCMELNQQARLSGMASSVAKINSVGLRLALHELRSEDTLGSLMRALVKWEDVPCQELFPGCDLELGDNVEFS